MTDASETCEFCFKRFVTVMRFDPNGTGVKSICLPCLHNILSSQVKVAASMRARIAQLEQEVDSLKHQAERDAREIELVADQRDRYIREAEQRSRPFIDFGRLEGTVIRCVDGALNIVMPKAGNPHPGEVPAACADTDCNCGFRCKDPDCRCEAWGFKV